MTLAAATADLRPDELLVASRLFGPLRLSADLCITFPDGMLGFAGERRFVLLPAASEGIYWMQSVDDATIAFLLVDPFLACPGYEIELDEAGAAAGAEPPLVLAIVTLPRAAGEACTANLQGPVLLDLAARRGRQVILAESGYGTRHPIDLAAR